MVYQLRPMLQTAKIAVAVGDYAVCSGTTGADVDILLPGGPTIPQNGAFKAVKGVRLAEITDGLTNTLLIGEKHVPFSFDGQYPWDCGQYDGHHPRCSQRAGGLDFPLAASDQDLGWRFGSRHPGICQFAFCDGTVRAIRNSIEPYILGLLAQRNDGLPIPDY